MHYLVLHPEKGLCVTTESTCLTLNEAFNQIPDITNKLLDEGRVVSATFAGSTCIIQDREEITPNDKIHASNPDRDKEDSTAKETPPEETMELQKEIDVPEECKGETWASTTANIAIADISDNSLCIEGNWEDRGCYWIIDCIPRNVRLIHSDSLQYNKEFSLTDCGK